MKLTLVELIQTPAPSGEFDWWRVGVLSEQQCWAAWATESCIERHGEHLWQLAIDDGSIDVSCSYCGTRHPYVEACGADGLYFAPVAITARIESYNEGNYWTSPEWVSCLMLDAR